MNLGYIALAEVNWHVCEMYITVSRSSSQENEAEEFKSQQTASLCYSSAKSTLKVPPTFNRVEKTKHKARNFVHHLLLLLSSCFFLAWNKSKSIQCMQILNTSNKCSANLLYSYTCFEVFVRYEWLVMAFTFHAYVSWLFKQNLCGHGTFPVLGKKFL